MGNRAVITVKGDNKTGVYLHWNGGAGSVEAFVKEVYERMGGGDSLIMTDHQEKNESDRKEALMTFYAHLFAVASEFFRFARTTPQKCASSVYMVSDVKAWEGGCDNGLYVIDYDYSFQRFESKDSRELQNLEGITEFYSNLFNSMSQANA